jgi:hypothetical protein
MASGEPWAETAQHPSSVGSDHAGKPIVGFAYYNVGIKNDEVLGYRWE